MNLTSPFYLDLLTELVNGHRNILGIPWSFESDREKTENQIGPIMSPSGRAKQWLV